MKSVKCFTLFLTLLTVLGAAHLVFAQGTDLGTIRGTVKDSTGAVIANAKVTATDLDTNTSRQSNTNGAGDFEIFGLKSGRYKVSVVAGGMSTDCLLYTSRIDQDTVQVKQNTAATNFTHFRPCAGSEPRKS